MKGKTYTVDLGLDGNKELVHMIGTLNLGDNQVLGKSAHHILAHHLGGKAVGKGNIQRQWIDKDGVVHAVGAGELTKAFFKSKGKGIGRKTRELKDGDVFVHIQYSHEKHCLVFTSYSKSEVESLIK